MGNRESHAGERQRQDEERQRYVEARISELRIRQERQQLEREAMERQLAAASESERLEKERLLQRMREEQERQRKEKEAYEKQIEEMREQQRKQKEQEEEKKRYLEPLEVPWRKICDDDDPWSEEVKEDLIAKILSIRPVADIKYLNIILIGQSASGKSSFFNTCSTALFNDKRLITVNMVYKESSKSVTSRLEAVPLKTKDGHLLPIRLFDCRGLSMENGVPTEDIRMIVQGHVKSGYKISYEPITEDDEKYRKFPELKDKMHCVVYVANADNPTEQLTDTKTQEQLKYVREILSQHHVPQFVLYNKVDRLRISNARSLRDIFRSQDVRDKCRAAAEYMQIPTSNVFPMSNYYEENLPTLEKDILALFYLCSMMQRANDFLARVTKDQVPDDFFE